LYRVRDRRNYGIVFCKRFAFKSMQVGNNTVHFRFGKMGKTLHIYLVFLEKLDRPWILGLDHFSGIPYKFPYPIRFYRSGKSAQIGAYPLTVEIMAGGTPFVERLHTCKDNIGRSIDIGANGLFMSGPTPN